VSTWDDPKVFAKPHTYETRYFRAPKFTELREFDCNAADETRAKYLMESPGSQSVRVAAPLGAEGRLLK
jgi:hypothetical protein